MARINIYSKDGTIKAVSDKLEYQGVYMGTCNVTVTVKSPLNIDFNDGDYILYNGGKFTLNYSPTAKKQATSGTYGESFIYENMIFNSPQDELTRCRMRDFVLDDNMIHYTQLPDFTFYDDGSLTQVRDRIQANLNRSYTGDNAWTVVIAPNVMATDGTAVKSHQYSISNMFVWDMLAEMNKQQKVNFVINNRTITIGAQEMLSDKTGRIFGYGKGNMLTSIEATSSETEAIITRMHAFGNTTNMPYRYYNKTWTDDAIDDDSPIASLNMSRLCLPYFATLAPLSIHPDKEEQYIYYNSSFERTLEENAAFIFTRLWRKAYTQITVNGTKVDASYVSDVWIDSVRGISKHGIRENDVTFDNDDIENIYPSMKYISGNNVTSTTDSTNDNGIAAKDGLIYNPDGSKALTFTITIGNIGFSVFDDALKTGETPQISMVDGMCGSRTFDINHMDAIRDSNGTITGYTLECKRVLDESLNLYYPYNDYHIKNGDTFVFLNIFMPSSYVEAASNYMLTHAMWYLSQHDSNTITIKPTIDNVLMAEEIPEVGHSAVRDVIKEGLKMSIVDSDISANTMDGITISSLTIKDGDDQIPQYEITLSNDKESDLVSRVTDEVKNYMTVKGGGLNTSEIESIVKSIGNSKFVSKLNDDEVAGSIAFKQDITVDGKATLNDVNANDIQASTGTFGGLLKAAAITAIGAVTALSVSATSMSANVFNGNLNGNANTATRLQTPRTIWGQSFDGSGDINGNIVLPSDKIIYIKGLDYGHVIRHYDDDTDGFGVSTGFSVKRYDNAVTLFSVSAEGNALVKSNIGTSNFASHTTGWNINNLGAADFRNIYADELRVQAFTADISQALAGSDYLTKSVSKLSTNFVVPAVNSTVRIIVDDIEGMPATQCFSNNDYIRFRAFNRTSGLTIANVWGTVVLDTTYGSNGFSNGTQAYTFTCKATSGAGLTVFKGSEVLDYGTSGSGLISRTTLDAQGSPYEQIATWITDPSNSANYTVHARLGNLGGIANCNGYGIYTDNGFFTGKVVIGDLTKTANYLSFDTVNGLQIKIGGTSVATTTDVSTAQNNAINSASSDATTKANNAYNNAVSTAATDATNKVNAIQIGGRNLLLNSATRSYVVNSIGGAFNETVITEDGFSNVHKIECTASGQGFYSTGINSNLRNIGDAFTISMYVKGNSSFTIQSVGLEGVASTSINLTTSWAKVVMTGTVSNNTCQALTFYIGWQTGNILYLRDVKIERGTKDTTYSPAPEDMVDQVTYTANLKVLNNTINGKADTSTVNQQVINAINTAATDATNKVNAVQVGGRNLLRNTRNWTTTDYWQDNGGGISIDSSITYLGQPTLKTTGPLGIMGSQYRVEENTYYTYSAMLYASSAITVDGNYPLHKWVNTIADAAHNEQNQTTNISSIPAKTWTLVSVTFLVPSGNTYFYPFFYGWDSGVQLNIAYIKCEKGTKATDWSPSPEDVDSSISAAQQAAQTYATTNCVKTDASNAPSTILNSVLANLHGNFTNIDGSSIYTGTLTAAQVNAVAINASSISTGTLSADRLAANSIDASKLIAGSITAYQIASNTITFNKLVGTDITAVGNVQAGSFNIGSGNFVVTSAGYLTATGATITGKINASEGSIGGFTIGTYALTATYPSQGQITINRTDGSVVINQDSTTLMQINGNGVTDGLILSAHGSGTNALSIYGQQGSKAINSYGPVSLMSRSTEGTVINGLSDAVVVVTGGGTIGTTSSYIYNSSFCPNYVLSFATGTINMYMPYYTQVHDGQIIRVRKCDAGNIVMHANGSLFYRYADGSTTENFTMQNYDRCEFMYCAAKGYWIVN